MAGTDDLAALAERMEQTGDYRILRRVPTIAQYAGPPNSIKLRRGLIVDVATSGFDPTYDKIIEPPRGRRRNCRRSPLHPCDQRNGRVEELGLIEGDEPAAPAPRARH